MSYELTWLEGTKESLRMALPKMKPAARRAWLIEQVIDYVAREIALYPQDAAAQPGQRVTGELHVAAFRVRYEIHLDTGVAFVTEVKPDERPKAA